MASLTKQAIVASYLKLCAKKSPERITVRDIVDDCEINRNTFYYYFQDVYALVEEVFLLWSADFCEACEGGEDLREGLYSLAQRILSEKKAAINLMRAFDGAMLEDYWLRATAELWVGWVERRSSQNGVSREAIRYVAYTCAIAFLGILRRWIRDGMKVEPHALTERFCAVWLCDIDGALLRYEANRLKEREDGR